MHSFLFKIWKSFEELTGKVTPKATIETRTLSPQASVDLENLRKLISPLSEPFRTEAMELYFLEQDLYFYSTPLPSGPEQICDYIERLITGSEISYGRGGLSRRRELYNS